MGDPQGLDAGVGIGKATGEEASSGRQSVEFYSCFGTLISHCSRLGAGMQ